MPRNMSFMLTTEQVRNRTKTVTRRLGWKNLNPGDIVNAVEKCQGLKKGERINVLCQIRIVRTKRVPLYQMQHEDCAREGFPEMTVNQFIDFFCEANKCTEFDTVTRIEFEYV